MTHASDSSSVRLRWIALLLAWPVVVLAVYFRHVWPLLAAGPSAWVAPEIGQTLRFTGLPHLREAMLRAVWAAGAAAAVLAAVAAVGGLVSRWLLPESATPTDRIVIGYAFGAGTVAYVLFALSAAGLYRPRIVATLFLAAAAAWVVAQAIRRRSVLASDGTGLVWRAARSIPRDDAAWALVTLFAVLFAGFCALAPEIEYDALWYHLELPRRWLAAGRSVDDLTEYISLYPLTWELLFGGALSLDGAVAAKLLHWSTLPVAACVAGMITRRISPQTSPWLAAAVFVTAPTVFWEATSAYVDLAVAVHAGIAVYAMLRAQGRDERRWLIVAGLQFGLACATKHLGLAILASALIVFAVSALRRRAVSEVVRASAVVLILAVAVPSPWYLRAWTASRNPVFPELYTVFGAEPPGRWSDATERGLDGFKQHFGRPRTIPNLISLPWDMTMHAARYGGTLGPLLLAFLPIGVAAARAPAARAVAAGALLVAAVWASPISSYQLRFLVPSWIVAAPLVAAGMQFVTVPFGRGWRLVIQTALAALLLVNLPPWTPLHEGDRQSSSGWLTHVVREPPTAVVLGGIGQDEWLRHGIRSYAAWQWIDAHTPVSSRVLTFFGGDHFYTHRARLWSESAIARSVTWDAAGQRTDIPAALRGLDITYLLAPSDELETEDQKRLPILQPSVLAKLFARVYADQWAVVYRVREGSLSAGTTDHRYGM